MSDADLISVVLTVETAKKLLAALSGNVLPTQSAIESIKSSLVRSLTGPPQ